MTCSHSLDDITGYAVLKTREHGERLVPARLISADFNALEFGRARTESLRHSSGTTDYARVLNLYGCPCDVATLAGTNL